ILGPTYSKGSYLRGNVTETGTNVPLSGVEVTLFSNPQPDNTNNSGDYITGVYHTGQANVLFEKVGYAPYSTTVNLVQGQEIVLDVQLTPLPPFNVQFNVTDASTGSPIFDAKIKLVHPLIVHQGATNALGEEQLTLFYQEPYEIYTGKWGYMPYCSSQTIDPSTGVINVLLQPGYGDDFELDLGWSINSTAQTGIWERGVPNATSSGSTVQADVPWDCGSSCYVTGNDANLHPDFDDVDQGNTVLVSPPMDLTGLTNPHFNYARGYYNFYGPQLVDDTLKILVSNGSQTVLMDQVVPPLGDSMQWEYKSIALNGLLPITSTMQISVVISDEDPDINITEAAFDEFYVTNYSVNGLVALQQEIKVFPNPAHTEVTFLGSFTNEDYAMFDGMGRCVQQGVCSEETLTLSVVDLEKGLYLLYIGDSRIRFIKD
ncbi:MAG: hypothetical protein EBV23_11625, partial [Flavobacteriia bacterium]|nr:hypothetical protein [Flavobacteriia bacterium]